MADKDQFTFEDEDDFPKADRDDTNQPQEPELSFEDSSEPTLDDQNEFSELNLSDEDDFPETDLSAAFLEGEHAAEEPVLDASEPKAKGGGNSKSRLLLMVLLLVIVGGGGAYYFMGLGETTPSVPTVPVPAQKTKKSVALPAKSAKAPAAPAQVKPAAKPVTVAVPPPPAPAKTAPKVAPVKQTAAAKTPPSSVTKPAEKVVATKPKVETAKQPATRVAVPVLVPESKAKPVKAQPATTVAPVPVSQKAVVATPAATSAKTVAPLKQVSGGTFALDAGSYLLESNRDLLVAKIKKLGYQPLVTPVDVNLNMTRLRLGTFGKDEVQEALAFARAIEPGAYSAPAGDGYVVYAGTFLKSKNIDKLSQRFLKEGIKVNPEPVQVVRTLSRIRFGSFATKEDATAAASKLSRSGLKSTVVKSIK